MESGVLIRQIMDMKKAAIDNTFAPIVFAERQIEEAMEAMFKYSSVLSEQDKIVITEWLSACRQGIERFRSQNNEYYNKVAVFFDSGARQA